MGLGKIKSLKEVCGITKKLEKEGKKVVFCHGFFDILHRGHVTLLVEAKKLGDVLIVGVDHDDNAKILKGPNRPINDHDSRMFVLANLEVVDYVFLIRSFKKTRNVFGYFDGLYRDLSPDILATTVKAGKHGEIRKKQAKEAGIRFVDIDRGVYDIGTTRIIKKLDLD